MLALIVIYNYCLLFYDIYIYIIIWQLTTATLIGTARDRNCDAAVFHRIYVWETLRRSQCCSNRVLYLEQICSERCYMFSLNKLLVLATASDSNCCELNCHHQNSGRFFWGLSLGDALGLCFAWRIGLHLQSQQRPLDSGKIPWRHRAVRGVCGWFVCDRFFTTQWMKVVGKVRSHKCHGDLPNISNLCSISSCSFSTHSWAEVSTSCASMVSLSRSSG